MVYLPYELVQDFFHQPYYFYFDHDGSSPATTVVYLRHAQQATCIVLIRPCFLLDPDLLVVDKWISKINFKLWICQDLRGMSDLSFDITWINVGPPMISSLCVVVFIVSIRVIIEVSKTWTHGRGTRTHDRSNASHPVTRKRSLQKSGF